MSITKAAVGSAFLYRDISGKLKGLEDTSLFQALNHVSKYSDDCWNYFKFRTAVESNKDLLEYCVEQLKPCGTKEMSKDNTYSWEYNNLMYQVIACLYPKFIMKRFKSLTHTKSISDLYPEKEDDKVYYYRKATGFSYENKIMRRDGKYGWKWEHTKSGIPLGPHGLFMTKDTAEVFGEANKCLLPDFQEVKVQIPRGMWWGIGKDEFTHYSHGWFLTNRCAYSIGYVCQVLAILPNGVVSQLYEEEWGDDNPKFMDHKKNKWTHPRWSFIKNIEQFQSKFEQKTNEYLDKLKQPPLGQQGASIIMPSGTGKSYYIDRQNQNESIKDEFIDCDPLTWETNAQPHPDNSCPWNWEDHLKIICLQVDQVVAIAKRRFFFLMGATWWDPEQVNAIVILIEAEHRRRLEMKEDKFEPDFYDKTIKARLIPQLFEDSKQSSIPIFNTILKCVSFTRQHFGILRKYYSMVGYGSVTVSGHASQPIKLKF